MAWSRRLRHFASPPKEREDDVKIAAPEPGGPQHAPELMIKLVKSANGSRARVSRYSYRAATSA